MIDTLYIEELSSESWKKNKSYQNNQSEEQFTLSLAKENSKRKQANCFKSRKNANEQVAIVISFASAWLRG